MHLVQFLLYLRKEYMTPPSTVNLHPSLCANNISNPVQKLIPDNGYITEPLSSLTARLGYITDAGNWNLTFNEV